MHQPRDPARSASRERTDQATTQPGENPQAWLARGAGRRQARHASSRGEGFGQFAAVTALALVPGAGLIAAGRRRIGGLLLGVTIAVALAAGILVLTGQAVGRVLEVAVQPRNLAIAVGALVAIALVWCLTIVATAWAARPERPSGVQQVMGVALVAALCAAVAAPSGVGVRYALIQRDLVGSLFSDEEGGGGTVAGAATPVGGSDPWAGVPRVNLLLLGSDAGANRDGVRPDSLIVASINTRTGDTVLFGLPRSLQNVPFSKSNPLRKVWPRGFNCGDPCLLNGVWEQAAVHHRDLFAGDPNPGLTATRDAVSQVLGMRIDSYALIDLRGFTSLVDAMGGVDVNVPRRIPIGGGTSLRGNKQPITGYIERGRRHLNGYQALWFARSREGSTDYDRMGRQRCMVTSLLQQANPAQLLARYPALARVAKKNIQTDIRQRDLPAWMALVQRVQAGKITSLPFTDKVISTVNPDFQQIRELATKAITPKPASSASTSPSSSSTPSSAPPTRPKKKDVGAAQDASAVC